MKINAYDDVWPSGKASAYFTLFVAFMLCLLDFMDRQIVGALLPFIKADYHLSDKELGTLVSIVNISIAILVIPSAYFIDKWSRKKMMCVMGLIWSLATGACAFAGSFSHLLFARFFVRVGEAGYQPAAQALLSTTFPKRLRATAISICNVGGQIGVPLGLMAGAFIATHWGWRHAFGVVAIPGIFLPYWPCASRIFPSLRRQIPQPHLQKQKATCKP